MGCDIHSFAEVKRNGNWMRVEEEVFSDDSDKTSEPFGWRQYGMFGFLADVRNYSMSPCIVEPRGLPDDSEWLNSTEDDGWGGSYTRKKDIHDSGNYHTFSHIYLKELLDYDYETQMEDRRTGAWVSHNHFDGAITSEIGGGTIMTVREFLGESFFTHLNELKQLGNPEDVRIVFWFDN